MQVVKPLAFSFFRRFRLITVIKGVKQEVHDVVNLAHTN